MCGIVGIVSQNPVNESIYAALTLLQHRGQDAAGIVTIDDENRFRLRKANGLVSDVFRQEHMLRLQGHAGLGHVRYPTAGSSSVSEAQPFYVNSPYGLSLVHNGNLTNSDELKDKLFKEARRHINTNSDSELLLNILANHLDRVNKYHLDPQDIFNAIRATHKDIRGAYACLAMIIGHGMVAFRDPFGIRPLVLGKREENGSVEYMFASESVALDVAGFELVRDVAPGEAIYVTFDGQLYAEQCAESAVLNPCIFEYVYFARPDSTIDGVSVYAARVHMGEHLGKKIAKEWIEEADNIDVVIPVPETSTDIALQIAKILGKPYRQGFVKNRYVGRTFIMPGQAQRISSVRRKLNTIKAEFKDKNVLLVDDSIVRGTTSEQIVSMARVGGGEEKRRRAPEEKEEVDIPETKPLAQFKSIYVYFEPESAALDVNAKGDIKKAAAILKENDDLFILFESSAAPFGSQDERLQIETARIRSVAEYLTQKCGITHDRIIYNEPKDKNLQRDSRSGADEYYIQYRYAKIRFVRIQSNPDEGANSWATPNAQ